MIHKGDNPENDIRLNKFIAPHGDGVRGILIALHTDKKQAIILAMNSSLKGDVKWGEMYLVKEDSPEEYPKVVRRIGSIPNTKSWKILT